MRRRWRAETERAFKETFPGLMGERRGRALVRLLCFSAMREYPETPIGERLTWPDEVEEQEPAPEKIPWYRFPLLFSYLTAARCEGLRELEAALQGNYSAQPLIEWAVAELGAGGAEVKVTEGDHAQGRVRTLDVIWPPHIEALLSEERGLAWATGDLFSIVTGRKWTRKVKGDEDREEAAEIKMMVAEIPAACEESREICEWLNESSGNWFAGLGKKIPEVAKLIGKVCGSEGSRASAVRMLAAIAEGGKPRYLPGSKTARCFCDGDSLQGLPRELRKILMRCHEFDLKSAQLAIVAGLWGITQVQEFLRSGRSFWAEILGYLGVDRNGPHWDSAKDLLKVALYSVIFGMEEINVEEKLRINAHKIGQAEDLGIRFMAHPLIVALLEARAAAKSKIQREGGFEDAFGRWIPAKGRTWRSLLAQQAQTMEFRLILPALKLAMKCRKEGVDDFSFVLLQHDGFSLSIRKEAKTWIRRFQGAVNEEAAKLGILTELELSYDPDRDEAGLLSSLRPRQVWLCPPKRRRGLRVGVADFSIVPDAPYPETVPTPELPAAAPQEETPAGIGDERAAEISATAAAHRAAWGARLEAWEAADRARWEKIRARRARAPKADPFAAADGYRWGDGEEDAA